ncbi:hypothetical protein ACKFKG_23525 [Phormidesmis sp. 146-35]
MQVELNPDEIHWLRHSVIQSIANLPEDATELRGVYEGVLEKLSAHSSSFISGNLLESLEPPKIFVLDHDQVGEYRV